MFAIIRGMMNSNHARRLTLRQLANSSPIHRMHMASATRTADARISVESRTRSSVDEWEEWSRQRARENELSPDSTRVQLELADQRSKPTKPALVPEEDSGFLTQLLQLHG